MDQNSTNTSSSNNQTTSDSSSSSDSSDSQCSSSDGCSSAPWWIWVVLALSLILFVVIFVGIWYIVKVKKKKFLCFKPHEDTPQTQTADLESPTKKTDDSPKKSLKSSGPKDIQEQKNKSERIIQMNDRKDQFQKNEMTVKKLETKRKTKKGHHNVSADKGKSFGSNDYNDSRKADLLKQAGSFNHNLKQNKPHYQDFDTSPNNLSSLKSIYTSNYNQDSFISQVPMKTDVEDFDNINLMKNNSDDYQNSQQKLKKGKIRRNDQQLESMVTGNPGTSSAVTFQIKQIQIEDDKPFGMPIGLSGFNSNILSQKVAQGGVLTQVNNPENPQKKPKIKTESPLKFDDRLQVQNHPIGLKGFNIDGKVPNLKEPVQLQPLPSMKPNNSSRIRNSQSLFEHSDFHPDVLVKPIDSIVIDNPEPSLTMQLPTIQLIEQANNTINQPYSQKDLNQSQKAPSNHFESMKLGEKLNDGYTMQIPIAPSFSFPKYNLLIPDKEHIDTRPSPRINQIQKHNDSNDQKSDGNYTNWLQQTAQNQDNNNSIQQRNTNLKNYANLL